MNNKKRHQINEEMFYEAMEKLKNVPVSEHPLGTEQNPLFIDYGYYKRLKKENMIDKDAWSYCIIQSFYYKKNGFTGYVTNKNYERFMHE